MSKELSPYQDLIIIITACACLDIDFISSNKCVKKFENIKQALKTLEIIKEKQVDISSLVCAKTVEQYNVKENGFIPLTQEEFDLLKEVLL